MRLTSLGSSPALTIFTLRAASNDKFSSRRMAMFRRSCMTERPGHHTGIKRHFKVHYQSSSAYKFTGRNLFSPSGLSTKSRSGQWNTVGEKATADFSNWTDVYWCNIRYMGWQRRKHRGENKRHVEVQSYPEYEGKELQQPLLTSFECGTKLLSFSTIPCSDCGRRGVIRQSGEYMWPSWWKRGIGKNAFQRVWK